MSPATSVTPMVNAETRFFAKIDVDPQTGCWVWNACKSDRGYGRFNTDGKVHFAYKWAYEHWVGPVPQGLVLDHEVCDNRACVNYEHLVPKTHRENILRGVGATAVHARKTHCNKGHALSGDNLALENGGRSRRCKACRRERVRGRVR